MNGRSNWLSVPILLIKYNYKLVIDKCYSEAYLHWHIPLS